MCSPNRNRSNHRSTALGLIIVLSVLLLFAAPAVADNVAQYTVAPNGSVVSAEITFTDLGTFYLVNPGFFGDETEITGITNFSLINESGVAVTPTVSKGTYTFAKGNYTLTYSAPVTDNTLYLRYAAPFDVLIYLPDPYTTGHIVLGQVSFGGVIALEDGATIVTFTDTKQASVTYYNRNRELILYIFAGVWLVVIIFLIWRYRRYRKKQLDPNEYA